MLERLEHRILINDAIGWVLCHQCLWEVMLDEAKDFISRTRPGFKEECAGHEIKVDGKYFVITFVLGEEDND